MDSSGERGYMIWTKLAMEGANSLPLEQICDIYRFSIAETAKNFVYSSQTRYAALVVHINLSL